MFLTKMFKKGIKRKKTRNDGAKLCLIPGTGNRPINHSDEKVSFPVNKKTVPMTTL